MNIKDKITEWQEFYINQCGCHKEAATANQELELVLFAIDTLAGGGGVELTVDHDEYLKLLRGSSK